MDDLKSIESTTTWDNVRYNVDPTLDPSLRHMVEKLLPLATYYMSVDSFVEQFSRFEYGTVNHALCSAIRVFLKEYLNFIALLEHQFQTSNQFTLHRLWFFAQDTLQQMRILHQLTNKIRGLGKKVLNDDEEDDIDAVLEGLKSAEDSENVHIPDKQKGAAILNILSERLIGLSGDPKCKQIYTFLLSRASSPYFDILHSWIYRGEIKDPYNEFMVLEKRNVKKENLKEDFNDAYWEMRYTIRQGGLVPVFLEPLKQQILLAGKFLNVVRECGVNITKPEEMLETLSQNILAIEQQPQNQRTTFAYRRATPPNNSNLSQVATRNDVWAAVDGGIFIKNLEIAYKYANQTLLHLLLNEQQLTARLRSLKHYFFLDQADFLTSFLDLAKDELRKPAQDIPLTRLQSLLDIVLRNSSSVAAYDPFKEEVVVAMSPLKLIDQLLRIINVAGMETSQLPLGSPLEMSTSGLLQDGQKSLSNSFYLLERSQSLSGSMILNSSTSNKGSNSTSKEVLNGYDALTLDYLVTFPLSLVISRKALTKYQLLFRHLLYLKHVEDLLCKAWMDQKGTSWRMSSGSPEIERWKFRIFTLRNQMLAFVQQFTYYVTNEVLEPNWRHLESNLTKASTVDEVLQYHSDFLDTCLKECMLTNSKLLRVNKERRI
ncbi:gamma-tubulin complex component protein [Cunninghamella echinulata]|nr:gamma-tubulin complex component protein [Cunninghamella echinulata]